jgi:hypothetical protein
MEAHDFSSTVAKSAIDIVTPVFENAVVLSGQYAKACGRDVILSKDMEYCMKYCAMNTVGKQIGSYFPEIYEEEESEGEEEIETVNEEDEPPFEPYSGDVELFKSINDAYDAWESWKPTNPSEKMIKNAIDSNEHLSSAGMEEF